jgi:hypothetical protein
MNPEKKPMTIFVSCSDRKAWEDISSVMKDERLSFLKTNKRPAIIKRPEGKNHTIEVHGPILDDCVALAQLFEMEIDGVLYCGPDHSKKDSCIGNKLDGFRKKYDIVLFYKKVELDHPIEIQAVLNKDLLAPVEDLGFFPKQSEEVEAS